MKRKVINVSYRKDSITFDDWMKYEIELLNEDGTTEVIPAYGKDLQDALSRVVHDQRAAAVERTTKKIPEIIWIILWFGYLLGWTMLTYEISPYSEFNGVFFIGGFGIISIAVLLIKKWFSKRNVDHK